MTIEELLIENQEILQRMKNEEWDTEKFIRELKGETNNEQETEAETENLGRSLSGATARVSARVLRDPCDPRQAQKTAEA